MAIRGTSDENWIIKRVEITAEHELERAPNDLKAGWMTWLKDHWPGRAGPKALWPFLLLDQSRWSASDEGPQLQHHDGHCPGLPPVIRKKTLKLLVTTHCM